MNKRIILFDGYCNFCNFWINLIIKRNKNFSCQFFPLQSAKGKDLLNSFNLPSSEINTVVYIDNKKLFIKSDAGLKILYYISWWGKIFYIFTIIPRPIRDFVFDFISRKRYKWFGKRDNCRVI